MLQRQIYALKETFNLKSLNFTHNNGPDRAIREEEKRIIFWFNQHTHLTPSHHGWWWWHCNFSTFFFVNESSGQWTGSGLLSVYFCDHTSNQDSDERESSRKNHPAAGAYIKQSISCEAQKRCFFFLFFTVSCSTGAGLFVIWLLPNSPDRELQGAGSAGGSTGKLFMNPATINYCIIDRTIKKSILIIPTNFFRNTVWIPPLTLHPHQDPAYRFLKSELFH